MNKIYFATKTLQFINLFLQNML